MPAGSTERRPDHHLDELVAGMLHRCQLQALLGAEMREQPALGHVRQVGEGSDRDTSQPDLAGGARRLIEHGVPSELASSHVPFIARSFVLVEIPGVIARFAVDCGEARVSDVKSDSSYFR